MHLSLYIDCLIKELCIDNSLGIPTYIPTTLTNEKLLTIINLFFVPLEFQANTKNWIFRTKLHKFSFKHRILLGLPNVPQKFFPNY